VGAILGGAAGSLVATKYGRRLSLIYNTAPYTLGYFIILSSYLISNGFLFKVILIVGRFITGVGMGWGMLIVPVSNLN